MLTLTLKVSILHQALGSVEVTLTPWKKREKTVNTSEESCDVGLCRGASCNHTPAVV